mgnify:CR=1 FL=1
MSDDTNAIEQAAVTAHWPGQAVHVCLSHAEKLQGIARAMGFTCSVTPYSGEAVCINCLNEAKRKAR